MNDNTWFKMFRKSEYSAVFQDANLWKIWCWCLIRASHKEQHFPVQTGRGTTIVSVQPGQFIFGRFSASKSLRMKPSSIWDRMKKLANLQNIGIQTDSHYSIITITKWNDYQNDIYKSDSQSDKQPTSNRQATDTYKNEENEEKIIISDFSLTPDQPIIAKKTLRKKENGKHRFCDSPYFDPNEFRANIGWSQELADYWWDVLADASEANETMKYNNWLAVARQWRRRKESS